jgi:hypothetical protein
MINGRFVVYGTPTYLKEKYSYGYLLKMKMLKSETDLDVQMAQGLGQYFEKLDKVGNE